MRKLTSLLYFIFFLLVLGSAGLFKAQGITMIEDKAMVEMAERMTHEGWTFKYPKSRKFLGIEIGWQRRFLWNVLAPKYKRGKDLRPLKSWGEQSLRYLELLVQEAKTKKIKEDADIVAATTAKEFAHWSSKVVNIDPLWQVYYKDKLHDIENFPKEPEDYKDWGFKDKAIYNKLNDIGAIDYLYEKLGLLKNKFEISRKTDMPRGKRIMMYDEIMHGWEEFASRLKIYGDIGQVLVYMEEAKKINIKPMRTDKEIMESVMLEYKDKF